MSPVFSLGIAIRQQTGTSEPAPVTGPVNLVPPTITGMARLGQALVSDTGEWMGNPTGLVRQWRRNGVAILGATAASYMLQAADLGSTISLAVTATNAQGNTIAISAETEPVTAASGEKQDSFVIALQGQSGLVFTVTGRGGFSQWNSSAVPRPDLAAGDWGRVVEPTTDSAGGVSIAAGTLIDREITTATTQNAVDNYIVSRGVTAIAQFAKKLMPDKNIIVVPLAVSGTSMASLMNDASADRNYLPYKDTLDHVRATYGEIDLLVNHWHGSEPTSSYDTGRARQWFMQAADGTPHVPGTDGVDHSIFDANVALGQIGAGTLPRRAGTLVAITAPQDRQDMANLLNSTAMAGMGMSRPVIHPHSGHTEKEGFFGQPWTAAQIVHEALLLKAGISYTRPAIASIVAASDGSYADVTVPVPVGHKLTTLRKAYNDSGNPALAVPARVSPNDYETDWFGFFIARDGVAIDARVPLTTVGSGGAANTRASFTLVDDGSASGTARLRITPEVAFQTGDRLTYRQDGVSVSGLGPALNAPWADFLYVQNPDLWFPDTAFPAVGLPVMPLGAPFMLSLGGVAQEPLSTSMAAATTTGIPAGTQVGDLLVAIADRNGNTAPGGDANWTTVGTYPGSGIQTSFRVATRVYQAGDAAPVFANANNIEILRFGAGHTVGAVASAFAAAGAFINLPELTAVGASSWDLAVFRSRHSAQSGWGVSAMPGWTRTTAVTGSRVTFVRNGAQTALPAVRSPAVIGGSANGGGGLHIEIVRP